MPLTAKSKRIKRGRFLNLERRRNYKGLIFVSPLILGLILLFVPGLVEAIRFGFSKIKIESNGYSLEPVGFLHYHDLLFENAYFIREIVESLSQLLLHLVLILIYTLFVAVVLNQRLKGRGAFRAILFMPIVISTGIITIAQGPGFKNVSSDISAAKEGFFSGFDLENLLLSLKIDAGFMGIISSAVNGIYTIITRSGVQLIIFLAGLQSISPAIYESATVEGATWWESFWKITVPMISPMIVVNTMYTVVDSFVGSENPVMNEIYSTIMHRADFAVGSARTVIYTVVVLIVLFSLLGLINRFAYYENRPPKQKKRRRI